MPPVEITLLLCPLCVVLTACAEVLEEATLPEEFVVAEELPPDVEDEEADAACAAAAADALKSACNFSAALG